MTSEDALLDELRASPRDETLWSSFYGRLYPHIFGLTAYLCRADADLAADLTQDAFLRFITSGAIQKVSTSAAAIAYLRAIVRNLVHDYYRKRLQHPTISTSSVNAEELERALNQLIQRSLTEADIGILPDLRVEERQLLRLAIEGCTVAEVAEQLGLTYTAAAVRLHRLRKYLRGAGKETTPVPVLADKAGR